MRPRSLFCPPSFDPDRTASSSSTWRTANEPPHVHVGRDRLEAKFWLDPVTVARAGSFSLVELRRIEWMIEENRYLLLEQWDASFGV